MNVSVFGGAQPPEGSPAATARLMATVDLPTPPLPAPTRMMFFTPGAIWPWAAPGAERTCAPQAILTLLAPAALSAASKAAETAVMGGAMRSPLTGLLFALELTYDIRALLPLLVATVISHAFTVLVMKRSILTEKVARRGYHVSREYTVDPLEVWRVGEIMDKNPPTIPSNMTVAELSDRLASGDPQLMQRQGTPIVDLEGRLAGIITRGDLVRALGTPGEQVPTVLEAGSRNLVVAFPDEPLRVAVARMLQHDIGRLPVVSREDPQRLIGYIGRSGIIKARLRGIEEESVRETSWRAIS